MDFLLFVYFWANVTFLNQSLFTVASLSLGILRNDCITDNDPDGKLWCSTKVNDKKEHVSGSTNWGYCSKSCIEESIAAPPPPVIRGEEDPSNTQVRDNQESVS